MYNVLKYGAKPGDRALVFWIPPSQMDVLALMFGLLKAGIVIVWLDPRTMSFSELLNNIELIAPRILFADPLVRRVFKTIQLVRGRLKSIRVVLGSKELNGSAKMLKLSKRAEEQDYQDNEGGAIMFTTGSTGPPKAVRLTAHCLAGQVDAYELAAKKAGLGGPGEFIAVHTGMNFNALDLALGNTTITLPDPANPGRINPKWIEEVDAMFKPCVMTASRVVYENLAAASEARLDKSSPYLANLRLAFSGGAPVTPMLHDRVCRALPNLTDIFSAYGCTEGLPLMLSGWRSTYQGDLNSEMVKKSLDQGLGVALGELCAHVEVFILNLSKASEIDELGKKTNHQIQDWKDEWECPIGEIGEMVIRSPSVSPFYVNNDLANATSKFKHPKGDPPMHRTGDLVFRDQEGNIWMTGRIAQAVHLNGGLVVPPVCIESIFDGVSDVKRCAFVKVKSAKKGNIPVLIVLRTKEGRAKKFDETFFISKIKNASKWCEIVDKALCILEYRESEEFPMDTRHNSKIRREILAQWASRLL